MMQIDDILVLARAGFNAAQIAALQQLAQPAAPAAAPAPTAAPAAPAPAPTPAPEAPAQSATDAKLDTLISLMQTQQLSQQQPAPPTADQILAEILDPRPADIK